MSKKAFRAESGLDAGGNNVTNVTDPREGQLLDGVNVSFFIKENTVQPFDKTRGYKQHFAVTHERRLWIAINEVIAGNEFSQLDWYYMRVDPTWKLVTSTPTPPTGVKLLSGECISANSLNNELDFYLPETAQDGDMIIVKDVGMYPNMSYIRVHTPNKPFENGKTIEQFTIPGSMKTFVFSNNIISGGMWIVHTSIDKIAAKIISKTVNPTLVSCGDEVYRKSSTGHIVMQLPKYAVNGDVVSTYDLDGQTPTQGATMQVATGSGHFIDKSGVTHITTNTSGDGHFVFMDGIWNLHDSDNRSRWKPIQSDYTATPLDHLSIIGGTKSVTVTLPLDASNGDYVKLSNLYVIDGVNVSIKVATDSGHKIVGDLSEFAYPKFKDLAKTMADVPRVDSVSFTGKNYGSISEFYFHDKDNVWLAVNVQLRIEHVDETNRDRPGVAPLATQQEVDKNHEQSPRDDMIVTPKTLANSVSTESRRGISRIATAAELQVITTGTHLNDVIVTPKRLNERQATESIRGLAEIATQVEANTATNDTHIITPKKLDARRASNTLAGIVKIIPFGDPSTDRNAVGTGVYNWSDDVHNEPFVLTPKSLNEAQATENSRGVAYIATQAEANTQGVSSSNLVIITPKTLDARRATEGMAGIAEIATQPEVNAGSDHTSIVTPRTLHTRKSTETMWGLTEIATQPEVDNGVVDYQYITPLKLKTWLSRNHFTPVASSGLIHSGDIWNNVVLDVKPATETQRGTLRVATQVEANNISTTTSLDDVIITAKKLNGRRATETLSGIAKIASDDQVKQKMLHDVIVTPAGLGKAVTIMHEYNMTEGSHGTGHTATLPETWVGNTTVGSTKLASEYDHNPYVVSPRGLNHALVNYLPKTAKAVDSDKLDGLDSTQYLRSDADDFMSKQIAFTENTLSTTNRAHIYHNANGEVGTSINLRSMREHSGATRVWEKLANGVISYSNGVKGDGQNKIKLDINSGELYAQDGTKRVYHQGFNPTAAEVGAYSKSEADGIFVNVAGDTMTGQLSVPNIQMNIGTADKWVVSGHTNGNLQFNIANVAKWYVDQSGNTTQMGISTATQYKVGNTNVIETDAMIHWDKLKAIPIATINSQGIVKLNNALDSQLETTAATSKAIYEVMQLLADKADGSNTTLESLKIQNWLQIGNVILRPNKQTKSLDFIWTDEVL